MVDNDRGVLCITIDIGKDVSGGVSEWFFAAGRVFLHRRAA